MWLLVPASSIMSQFLMMFLLALDEWIWTLYAAQWTILYKSFIFWYCRSFSLLFFSPVVGISPRQWWSGEVGPNRRDSLLKPKVLNHSFPLPSFHLYTSTRPYSPFPLAPGHYYVHLRRVIAFKFNACYVCTACECEKNYEFLQNMP